MNTLAQTLSTRDLRSGLSEALGRTMYAGERIGISRNGKLAAVLVSIQDLETLEAAEEAADLAAYRRAKAEDDGIRIALEDLIADLGQA